jgi:small-conductance mechanosensitive channel
VKNEEVVIPNSQLSGDALINFSRLNDEAGVVLPVRISIGYNTPWRQVRDMMIEAARRTEGVRREPAPEVLQTALSDFYVEYQLNAVALDPARRVPVLSDLHAHILDVFNENAVQIMSPHYRADPPQPVLAPAPRRTLPAA